MPFTIHTDYKSLVPLLASKELAKLLPRIQRFRLRLARYSPNVIHVPGSSQIVADALSIAPSSPPKEEDLLFSEEVQVMVAQTFLKLLGERMNPSVILLNNGGCVAVGQL
ncbi:retrovirus-related pol polyprotein from transposon opus [Plakobranchus ocellatus]|uniref:Retrovirus-related pol polyprotein from transposon opus n=1 Tax=Plakobranchus ocellatus TaxID=259542 RepID=A0AAV3YFM2_9GAST|nr:retrovirus-related pol polyprotein from transposon opus [Plakobranchus ocellatus]